MSRHLSDMSDPRARATYRIPEAAHYLRLPKATLRAWVLGQPGFEPPIAIADPNARLLSFYNVVEAHVLAALRRHHKVPLQKVRAALRYLEKTFPAAHPLATHAFATDGLNLFVERYGELISASSKGQTALKQVLETYLSRIDYGEQGDPLRLFLFTRRATPEEPKVVMLDPRVSFGRPVLAGTGIPTAVIADRYKAGEAIHALAEDYGRAESEIEEAIRCELKAA